MGAFLIVLLTVSCKKETPAAESSAPAVTEIPAPAPQTIEKEFEVQAPTTTVNQGSNPVQTQVAPAAAGMNPAHGQPNHRCDIAVGAPLNSPKGATPPPPPPTQTTQSNVAPIVNPTDVQPTKPGMNPPHGQAGHRCEIAVGAPLPK